MLRLLNFKKSVVF